MKDGDGIHEKRCFFGFLRGREGLDRVGTPKFVIPVKIYIGKAFQNIEKVFRSDEKIILGVLPPLSHGIFYDLCL